ncbi:MAG TPA: glycosyltransferase family 87 protein [Dehalococcoidia bacterium]|nr:glycosyltransferase family 87 protein [Dehalococcoidia bacterium]
MQINSAAFSQPFAAGSRRTITMVVAVLVVAAVFARVWFPVLSSVSDRLHGELGASDYTSFYAAGKLVVDGHAGDLYDLDALHRVEIDSGYTLAADDTMPFFNPPFVAVLFAPLALLGPVDFGTALLAIVVALVIAGGFAAERMLGIEDRRLRLAFWLAYLSLQSVSWVVMEQQLSMLLFLGLLGFAFFQMRGDEGWSGVSLALLLVKPQMLLLLVALLIWKQRWDALRSLTLIAGALAAVSAVVAGLGVLTDYPRFVLDSTSWVNEMGIYNYAMFGLNGLVANLTGDDSPSMLLTGLLALPVLGAVAWAWRGDWEPTSSRFPLLMAIALLGALLLNPHLYLQDMVLMFLAAVFAARWAKQSRWSALWPLFIAAAWLPQFGGRYVQLNYGLPVLPLAMIALLLVATGLLWLSDRADDDHDEALEARLQAMKRRVLITAR